MIIVTRDKPEVFRVCTYPGVAENRYLISNYGGINQIGKTKIRYPRSKTSQGYPHTSLCTDTFKKYKDVLVHRLVAWEFVDGYSEEDDRIYVNHRNSNKTDYYFENLEWATVSENMVHAFTHGNKIPSIPTPSGPRDAIRGTSNPNSKFSEEDVRKICGLLEAGKKSKEILRVYNTTKKDNQPLYTLIMSVKHRKSWHHITKGYDF